MASSNIHRRFGGLNEVKLEVKWVPFFAAYRFRRCAFHHRADCVRNLKVEPIFRNGYLRFVVSFSIHLPCESRIVGVMVYLLPYHVGRKGKNRGICSW